MTPKISIIIPWYNRSELVETYNINKKYFDNHNCEIIVINCEGDTDLINGIKNSSANIINIPHKFNKSLAVNYGAYQAKSDYLLVLDADLIFIDDFIGYAINKLDDSIYITPKKVFERDLPSKSHDLVEMSNIIKICTQSYGEVSIQTNTHNYNDGSREAPGIICITKNNFLSVGGLNSDLTTWGWEDIDLLFRLELLLKIKRINYGEIKHLPHSDNNRCLEKYSKHQSQINNMKICLEKYKNADIIGTYEKDILLINNLKLTY